MSPPSLSGIANKLQLYRYQLFSIYFVYIMGNWTLEFNTFLILFVYELSLLLMFFSVCNCDYLGFAAIIFLNIGRKELEMPIVFPQATNNGVQVQKPFESTGLEWHSELREPQSLLRSPKSIFLKTKIVSKGPQYLIKNCLGLVRFWRVQLGLIWFSQVFILHYFSNFLHTVYGWESFHLPKLI